MTTPNEFFILSLKWSKRRDGLLSWWGPDDGDYVFRLDGDKRPAGRYTREQVESRLSCYHNGTIALAVPCDITISASIRVADSTSRSIDQDHVDDRVVEYAAIRLMIAAAYAWRRPTSTGMSKDGTRERRVYGPSAYVRHDATITSLRSGIDNDCVKCGKQKGVWCTSKKGKRLLSLHKERRDEGKLLADKLVTTRGRERGLHKVAAP